LAQPTTIHSFTDLQSIYTNLDKEKDQEW